MLIFSVNIVVCQFNFFLRYLNCVSFSPLLLFSGMIPLLGLHPDPSKKQRGKILQIQPRVHQGNKHDIMLVKIDDLTTPITPVTLPDCSKAPTT